MGGLGHRGRGSEDLDGDPWNIGCMDFRRGVKAYVGNPEGRQVSGYGESGALGDI